MKKLYVFWHNYVVNDWKRIVEDQFSKLVRSGLYRACEGVTCGAVCDAAGEEEHGRLMSRLIQEHCVMPSKFKAVYDRVNSYEYTTLKLLQDFCKGAGDAYVLYFHTKGVSHTLDENRVAKDRRERRRTRLDEVNLLRWRECVEKLDEGNMCCGTQRKWKFYSGNFWWARAEYIRTLPELVRLYPGGPGNYKHYEKWLLWSDRGRWSIPRPRTYAFPWEDGADESPKGSEH